MPTCPNGHQSVAEDWCEVCGHRMLAPAAAAVPPPAPPAGFPPPGAMPGGPGPAPGPGPGPGPMHGGPGPGPGPMPGAPGELCPQCNTPREEQAPFCEQCRFNFLTNSPTTYIPPTPPGPQPQQPQQQPPPQPHMGVPGQPMYPQAPQAPQPQHQQFPPHPQQPQQHQQPPPQQSGDWVISPPSQHQGVPPQQGMPPQGMPPQQQGPVPGQAPGPGPGPGGYGYPQQGQPPQPGAWMVSIGADPQYFQAMMRRSGPEASQLSLPAYAPEQQVPLGKPQITIGRRRQSTGESPDIDLARPPEDPGVSHQHAILIQQADGSWAVVDQDSTNGTTVNGADDPIQPFVPVPLKEGDRVHLGAWTTLTLYRS
jgi:hypothetical protein